MPRSPRRLQWTEEACYHLMDRGHNREPVFTDDEDRQAFLNLVARYQKRFGLRLYHYCLLTNHFHLLLQLDEPRRLSALMAGLLRAYVHHCARRHGFVGHPSGPTDPVRPPALWPLLSIGAPCPGKIFSPFSSFPSDPIDRRLQLHRFVSHILVATTGCTSQLSRVGTAWSLEQTVAQP
jgi:REP element-mobilizing transposase RayT